MHSIPMSLVESRVDWFTGTCLLDKLAPSDSIEPAVAFADALLREERYKGNDKKPFRLGDFKGIACGQAAVGQCQRGLLFRLSGQLAGEWWRRAYQLSTNVSRLDSAVTIHLDEQWVDLTRHYEQPARAIAKVLAPHRKVTRIDGGRHGRSLYIGSRASESYGRLYDKEAESKSEAYRDCFRFEVEWKKDAANLAAARLDASECLTSEVNDITLHWFAERGIELGELSGSGLDTSGFRQVSTDDRRIAWLKSDVRKTVQRLVEAGKIRDVVAALGLTEKVHIVSDCVYSLLRDESDGEQTL